MGSRQGTKAPIVSVWLAASLALLLLAVLGVGCGSEVPTPTPPTTETPDEPTPTADLEAETMGLVAGGAGLAVPPGFGANVFFLGLSNPTSIAVSDDGVVYVSQQDGAIAALRDLDSDGEADSVGLYARGFPAPLGSGAPGRHAVRIEQRDRDRTARLGRRRTAR